MLSHYDIIFELAIKLHKYFSNIYGIWAQLNILFFLQQQFLLHLKYFLLP